MTDDDRIRLSFRSGGRTIGPTERQRCEKHPRRWVLYRWEWDDDISAGEPVIVRSCAACIDEDE